MDNRTITIPRFHRAADYVGVWAIDPMAAEALQRMCSGGGLQAHVQASSPPILKSAIEVTKSPSGVNVAVIKVEGTLMKQQSSMEAGTSTVRLRRDIQLAVRDSEIGAILLAVDSPGGTVAGTEALARDVANAAKQKPVWAQVDDMAASAAYWIASQATAIYAGQNTDLIGSIGTILSVVDTSKMAEANGLQVRVFSTGALKGAGMDGMPITEEQAAYFQGLVDSAQVQFDAWVKKGRGLSQKSLDAVKTGEVFSASDALSKKLIDGIQPMEKTIADLGQSAKKSIKRAASVTGGFSVESKKEIKTMPLANENNVSFTDWLQAQGHELSAEMGPTLVGTFFAEHPGNYAVTWAEGIPDVRPVATSPTETQPAAIGRTKRQLEAELEEQRESAAAELERVQGIREACQGTAESIKVKDKSGKLVSLESHAVREGWTVDRTSLEILRQSRPQGPAIISKSHETSCTAEALQASLLMRSGVSFDHKIFRGKLGLVGNFPSWLRHASSVDARERAMDAAWQYRDMSALDICREAIRLDGKEIPRSRQDILKASFGGGALTGIFTTSVNAVLLSTYADYPDSTMGWVQVNEDIMDFKTNERPRQLKASSLGLLPAGGEAEEASRSDITETYKIARYAKKFTVDEQDIINDRLQALSDMPREMGFAAAILRPDLVYSRLFENATLADSVALFDSSTHANTATSAALASATLATGLNSMFIQRENTRNLGLRATHLIVPAALQWTAKVLLNSAELLQKGSTDATFGNVNPYQDLNLTLVTDPRLDNGVIDPSSLTSYAGDTNDWFLACANAKTIEVGYLAGTGGAPQVRSYTLSEGRWGMGWDINMDIGAKVLDYKGLYRGQG